MATPVKENTCMTQAAEYKVTTPDGDPVMPLGPPLNGPAASDERSIGAVPATQVLQLQEKRGTSSTSANGIPAQTVNLEQINTQGSNVIVHRVSDTYLKICLENKDAISNFIAMKEDFEYFIRNKEELQCMMKKFRETDWESFEAFTVEQNRKRKQPRGASATREAVDEPKATSSEEIEMVEDHQTADDLADFKVVTYKKPKAKQPKTATNVSVQETSTNKSSNGKKGKSTTFAAVNKMSVEESQEVDKRSAGRESAPLAAGGQPKMQAVVFRPTCKRNVMEFTPRQIKSAAAEAGVKHLANFTLKYNQKANTIAALTKDTTTADELTQFKKIYTSDGAMEFQAVRAQNPNQCKGIVYFKNIPEETDETLLEEVSYRTHNIVQAHIFGPKRSTVLLTFEGTTRPRYVRFCNFTYKVHEYRPKPLICFNCHRFGHRADICPSENSYCGKCGHEHDESNECTQPPKCRNCGGKHPATDRNCPRRTIPPSSDKNAPPKTKKPPPTTEDIEAWPELPQKQEKNGQQTTGETRSWADMAGGNHQGGFILEQPIAVGLHTAMEARFQAQDARLDKLEAIIEKLCATVNTLVRAHNGGH
ncbi:hypothetical protein ISCGN_021811 [Ixodes scapularis]